MTLAITDAGDGNHGDSPLFGGGPFGTWTAAAVAGANPGQTTLTDDDATFEEGELAGKFLNPDTTQTLQTLIVDNTATEITVWGDVVTANVVVALIAEPIKG